MAGNPSSLPLSSGMRSPGEMRSRLREPAFWGAIAGMALALALACAIVASEMIGLYGDRAHRFQRKLDRMQARLVQMQSRLTSADNQMAEMQREAAFRDQFERIFAAPDGKILKLEVRNRTDIGGALVLSHSLGRAALDLQGLSAPETGTSYVAWWVRRQGNPTVASWLDRPQGKSAEIIVELSLPPADATEIIITQQPLGRTDRPGSPLIFKGQLRRLSSPLRRGR